ncbi:hypothetical protein ACEZCY_25465 [Streptacidiphilus sp. N1-12]|uniref:Uncharacterized protein n=2 Tax=Streptacidiphilus alkalitolerans TaxID=3342712 RepID=A0ABV6WKL4_9ACTN
MAADSAHQDLLHGYLAGLDRAALTALLTEAAAADEGLAERLRTAAVRESLRGGSTDPAALARAVATALEPVGPLDRDGARHYAEQVQDAVGLLRRALDGGAGAVVVPLAEQAIVRFGEAVAGADGPSGALSGAADRLAALHLAACEQARPDPVSLAEWLAERHLSPDHGRAPSGVAAYAELLGEVGLAAYGAVLGLAWGQQGAGQHALARRMEELHTLRGDTDALVAVLATDLSHPSRHLRIAELLAAAGRLAEAVDWAERGLEAAPGQRTHDAPLMVFLTAHYGAVGRRDDAVALHRDQFLRRPDPAAYRALLEAAGPEGWTGQREWALAELHRRAAVPTARSWENPAGRLIEVLVAEGESDAAWSAAVRYRAPHHALLRLAQLRAATHPADAVPVYRQEVDEQIEAMTRESYRAAVGWILRLRDLYQQLGTPEEFGRLLAEIRGTHRAKGSLLADLDAKGL